MENSKQNQQKEIIMSSINNKLSEFYGIVPCGPNGMEIIREGKSYGKFTKNPSRFENWQAALDRARELFPYEKKNIITPGIDHRAEAEPIQSTPADPEPFPKVEGEGGAQYTFELKDGQQLALF